MLKWTGALAGAAIIGGAVVYGATYKAPPPPPPSFKPPLSADVQTTVDGIVQNLVNRHAGETLMYGACSLNCAGTGCLFKWRVKNNVVTSMDTDDTDHPGVGREDRVMTQQDFDWAQFQRRGCPHGYAWVQYLYSPDRVLYPIQRAPGTLRGANQWVRIDWPTAINTISSTMQQMKAQYGPFFLLCSYGGDAGLSKLGSVWGAGTEGYGLCSDDCARIMGPFTGLTSMAFTTTPGNDSPDSLKYSKAVIALGMVNFTTHYGGSAFASGWYRRMTREKGTVPTIYLDPKYSWDAEVSYDQWIPIKPGTDNAFLLAMAYVILTEKLYDPNWVNQYMYGFQQQADYILGNGGAGVGDFDPTYTQYDKVPKTPQWAEQICGVPAATITAIAELYGKTKPAVLIQHSGVRRKSYGEYTLKTNLFLNVLTGNGPYVQGGFVSNWTTNRSYPITQGAIPTAVLSASVGGSAGYAIPTFYRAFHWWKAVQYGTNVLNGGPSIMNPGQKMTWKEWGTLVGFNAAPQFLTMFNPRMLWGNSNDPTVMGENTNAQIQATINPAIAFSFHQHCRVTATGKYRDVILPLTDADFETAGWTSAGYGGFDSSLFISQPIPTSMIPGQAKSTDEICCYLLEALGGLGTTTGMNMAKSYWADYKGYSTFKADYDAVKPGYWQKNGMAWLAAHGVANPPTWDQVTKADKGHGTTQFHLGQFTPNIDTYCGQSVYGAMIDTKSGKFEVFTPYLADPTTRYTEHFDFKGRKFAHMPNDWKDLQPISVYRSCYRGMEDFPSGMLNTYPLMLLTSNSRYRIHYFNGDPGTPFVYQCYRHSVILSPTDAKARGIKDNDLCRIYNEKGQMLLPAHVTNRLMPGAVQIRTGMPPKWSSGVGGTPQTMDLSGCANVFTGGDDISPVSPAKVTSTVQVELYGAGKVYS